MVWFSIIANMTIINRSNFIWSKIDGIKVYVKNWIFFLQTMYFCINQFVNWSKSRLIISLNHMINLLTHLYGISIYFIFLLMIVFSFTASYFSLITLWSFFCGDKLNWVSQLHFFCTIHLNFIIIIVIIMCLRVYPTFTNITRDDI